MVAANPFALPNVATHTKTGPSTSPGPVLSFDARMLRPRYTAIACSGPVTKPVTASRGVRVATRAEIRRRLHGLGR